MCSGSLRGVCNSGCVSSCVRHVWIICCWFCCGGCLYFMIIDSCMDFWFSLCCYSHHVWSNVLTLFKTTNIRIPPTWQGTILLTDGTFSAKQAGRGDELDYRNYRQKLQGLTNDIPDHRIQWLDGLGISRNHRLYSENGPDHVSWSQHFHGGCHVDYEGMDQKIRQMRVCSNITEMMAQLLLNYALGPKPLFVERVEKAQSMDKGVNTDNDDTDTMVYCHACPKELTPFHITPFPNMTCATGTLHPRSHNEIIAVPETCPMECLDLEVRQDFITQSGIVHERLCPISVFQPAAIRMKKIQATGMRYEPKGDGFYLFTIMFTFTVMIFYRKQIRLRLRKHRPVPMSCIEEWTE